MANNTLEEIYNQVYFMLGEPSDSQTFDLNMYVIPTINQIHSSICKGIVVDETLNPPRTIKAWDLRFIMKQQFITNVTSVPLTVEANVGDTELYGAFTNYMPAWHVVINGNVIAYTGNTWSQLTGISTTNIKIESKHVAGSIVKQVRLLPSTANQTIEVEYMNSTLTYNVNQYPYYNNMIEYVDYRSPKDLYYFYSYIYDNSETNNRYLFINGYNSPQDKFIVRYMDSSTNMVAPTDECNLPDTYWISVIAVIVAGKLLYKTDEQWLWITFLKQWYAELEAMYNYYAETNRSFRRKVKTKPMNRNNTMGSSNKRFIINL